MNEDLILYYKERALEYESIYAKPERQEDLLTATRYLQEMFAGLFVLEIACGTGYWTERLAQSAASIYATDINEEVIDIARKKQYNAKVTLDRHDLYELVPDRKYNALFGGFIWSHVLLQDLDGFIRKTKQLLPGGGLLVFMDNRYVEGSNHPVSKTDDWENTYQSRKLKDGSSHLVLKNFPDRDFLSKKLGGDKANFTCLELKYFWIACCRIGNP